MADILVRIKKLVSSETTKSYLLRRLLQVAGLPFIRLFTLFGVPAQWPGGPTFVLRRTRPLVQCLCRVRLSIIF